MKTMLLLAAISASAIAQTPDQILDRYEAALGGRAALAKLKSITGTGTMTLAAFSSTGSYELLAKEPNKVRTTTDSSGYGVVQRGFNGTVGWSKDPQQGLRSMEGPALASMKRSADFHYEIHIRQIFAKLVYKGKERVRDREANVIEGTAADGAVEKMYFDTQTRLLIRKDIVGAVFLSYDFEDYRKVGAITMPFRTRLIMPNREILYQLEKVVHNAPIEDAKFEKPSSD